MIDRRKVNPPHYKGDYAMRVIEDFALDFTIGTAVKYLLRAGKKANEQEEEDLCKAQWYINRRLKQLAELKETQEAQAAKSSTPTLSTPGEGRLRDGTTIAHEEPSPFLIEDYRKSAWYRRWHRTTTDA